METMLELLSQKFSNEHSHVAFLRTFFKHRQISTMIEIHQLIASTQTTPPSARCATNLVASLAQQILEDYESLEGPDVDTMERLIELFQNHHLLALHGVHDTVASKSFEPRLPELSTSVDEDDHCVKIVRLIKNAEPLGATIKVDEDTGAVCIARVMQGGAADRSGLIEVGDEVRDINGTEVHGKSAEEIVRILSSVTGSISLKLVPGAEINNNNNNNLGGNKHIPEQQHRRVRALFSYNPDTDPAIPCRQAGLGFRRRDILHIVSEEPTGGAWWQARLEGAPIGSRAGLIPSPAALQTANPQTPTLYYQPVVWATPSENHYRPIVLLAEPGVGRKELTHYLLKLDPDLYRAIVPANATVSQAADPTALKSEKYRIYALEHFGGPETRALAPRPLDITASQIERLDYRRHHYVISPPNEMLPRLCKAEIQPIVIRLLTPDEVIADDEATPNSHLIDETLTFDTLDSCADRLLSLIHRFHTKASWIPAEWKDGKSC